MTELQIESDKNVSPNKLNSINFLKNKTFFQIWKGASLYVQSLLLWRIWMYMGISEIRRRYRRTLLGPFWATLSVSIFIGCLGMVFPRLWHMDAKQFLPYFSSGFVIWTLVSTTITEGCGTFIDVSSFIKQINLPCPVYANSVVIRNFLTLLHHLVVYVAIMIIFRVPVNANTFLLIPGILILALTSSWFCILFGFLTARFRDIKQIVASFLQISIFVTPIFWRPSQFGETFYAKLIVAVNPLYHFIEIARAPLLGQQPAQLDWVFSIVFCMVGWLFTMNVLGKYYRNLVFWL